MLQSAFLLLALSVTPPDSSLSVATFDSAWTTIRDGYYDSTFRGIDWNAVRDELRPRAAAASSSAELRQVIRDMTARLGESHFTIIPAEASEMLAASADPDGVKGDVGLELRLVDRTLLVVRVDSGGPAWEAGVRPGWELLAADGEDASEVISRVLDALEPGGLAAKLAFIQIPRALESELNGAPGTTVPAVFRNEVSEVQLTLTRRPAQGRTVRYGFLPPIVTVVAESRVQRADGCVKVIRFNSWMAPIAADLDRAIQDGADCAGVILDLRGNGGGVAGMIMGVAGHFLERPDSLGTLRFRTTTIHFVANPRYSAVGGGRYAPHRGRLAVLVDEQSASTSEIFAAAMQVLGRARVFGMRSPGLALPARITRLPNDDILMYVVADLTLPDGSRVEGQGVQPDIEAGYVRAALLAGRDVPLEQAIEWTFSND